MKEFTDVSTKIQTLGVDGIIEKYFKEEITDEIVEYSPEYKCLCSKDYVKGILISLGKKELDDIIEKEGQVKVDCQFCEKKYIFSKEDVEELYK